MRRTAAADVWHKAAARIGLPAAHSGWHDLRHYRASMLIAAGMSPRAVADRLGHADPAETLRTYTHLWPNDQARATATIDAALAGFSGASGTVTYLPGRAG